MAYIRTHETTTRRKGKAVKRYEVVWTEAVTDAMGLPVPTNPANPTGRKKQRARQESYATREDAEARRDELNAARRTAGGTAPLAEQRKAGEQPFGYYAQGWLDAQALKAAQGRLKDRTVRDYRRILDHDVLPTFGSRAVAGITPRDLEDFLAALVTRASRNDGGVRLSPKSVEHIWSALRRVLKYATQHGALDSNPTDRVDFQTRRATTQREKFEHHPLTPAQVSALSGAIAGEVDGLPAYPIYALMVEFLAYSGLRAAENTGLEVGDLEFTTRPGQPTRCTVHVRRTKERHEREWKVGTPKSKKSRRSVPLPPWLSTKLWDYLSEVHPNADVLAAPLWPSRKNGGGPRTQGARCVVPYDWSQPLSMGTLYEAIMKPALAAVDLPASSPAKGDVPAQRGVRLHDLRHTFATMQLMAGVHFMQVSKWLGHSTFTLTLDTYGDWIPTEDGGALNNLPEPTRPQVLVPEDAPDVTPLLMAVSS